MLMLGLVPLLVERFSLPSTFPMKFCRGKRGNRSLKSELLLDMQAPSSFYNRPNWPKSTKSMKPENITSPRSGDGYYSMLRFPIFAPVSNDRVFSFSSPLLDVVAYSQLCPPLPLPSSLSSSASSQPPQPSPSPFAIALLLSSSPTSPFPIFLFISHLRHCHRFSSASLLASISSDYSNTSPPTTGASLFPYSPSPLCDWIFLLSYSPLPSAIKASLAPLLSSASPLVLRLLSTLLISPLIETKGVESFEFDC
ncbi:hypothetical protein ACLOJK_010968 [Asimina triloba]